MIVVGLAGIASVFAVPGYASDAPSGVNYQIITALLNGQSGLIPGSIDTRVAALVAYRSYLLGQVAVSQGDVIALSVVKTGTPTILYLPGSFGIRVEIAPKTPTG